MKGVKRIIGRRADLQVSHGGQLGSVILLSKGFKILC